MILFRDSDMYVLIHDSPAHRGLSSPRTGERTQPDVRCSEEPATQSDPGVDHDETLLVAALEVIESRRTALEWLLEADLLCQCLV